MKRLCSILLLLCLLTGCAQPVKDYELQTTSATETAEGTDTQDSTPPTTEPKPQRVYATYPTTDSNRNYYSGQRIMYYDPDLRRSVYLCSQANCKHSDFSCKAYLGEGRVEYEVMGDWAYASVDNTSEGGNCVLLKQNYITGERQILMDLTPPEGYTVHWISFAITGNTLFYQYSTYLLDTEERPGYEQTNHRNYAYSYDLTTGETELLLDEPFNPITSLPRCGLALSTCTGNFLTVVKTEPFDGVLSLEEYVEQGNDEKTYDDYFLENRPAKNVYSLNRKTGEERFLYNGNEACQQDLACYRDRGCSFVVDDTVYIYDGYTGEVRECFQQENIGWQGYLDGRIFCNYHDGDPYGHNYRYLWYDLTTGEIQAFNESRSGFIFGLDSETADYFYSKYGYNGKHYISKQDFYNENYDNAF